MFSCCTQVALQAPAVWPWLDEQLLQTVVDADSCMQRWTCQQAVHKAEVAANQPDLEAAAAKSRRHDTVLMLIMRSSLPEGAV